MKSNTNNIYYNIGKFLISIAFFYKAIEFFSCVPSLSREVPSYFYTPAFWIIILGIVWAAAGISFLFNIARRLMALLVMSCIIIILITSTARGFEGVHDISSTLLKFTGWFCLMGSALMLGSYGNERYYTPDTHEEIFTKKRGMFTAGRFFIGVFFIIAGILHLCNVSSDAAYCLPGFPAAKFWVIFTGICWIACGIAFWFNLLNKLAAWGAIILITIITIMINLRGINYMNAWQDITQLFSNVALIGACLVLASRGYWWFEKPKEYVER